MLWMLQKDFQILIYAVASAHRQSYCKKQKIQRFQTHVIKILEIKSLQIHKNSELFNKKNVRIKTSFK